MSIKYETLEDSERIPEWEIEAQQLLPEVTSIHDNPWYKKRQELRARRMALYAIEATKPTICEGNLGVIATVDQLALPVVPDDCRSLTPFSPDNRSTLPLVPLEPAHADAERSFANV